MVYTVFFILKISKKADVIFIDPPYETDLYDKALKIILDNQILSENGIIILEHPIKKEINMADYTLVKTKEYGNKQISFLTI